MNELFTLPPSQPTPLAALRMEYDAARLAYDEASEAEDNFGEPIPSSVKRALDLAADRLRTEEYRIARERNS